jgi:hypothetical protein
MDSEKRANVFGGLSDATRLCLLVPLACRDEMSGTGIARRLRISRALSQSVAPLACSS